MPNKTNSPGISLISRPMVTNSYRWCLIYIEYKKAVCSYSGIWHSFTWSDSCSARLSMGVYVSCGGLKKQQSLNNFCCCACIGFGLKFETIFFLSQNRLDLVCTSVWIILKQKMFTYKISGHKLAYLLVYTLFFFLS